MRNILVLNNYSEKDLVKQKSFLSLRSQRSLVVIKATLLPNFKLEILIHKELFLVVQNRDVPRDDNHFV